MSDSSVESAGGGSGTGWFHSSAEGDLFFRWARPIDPRGVLIVVHGLGEHSDRYKSLSEALVAASFAYYGYDLRGHGRSPGKRGDVQDFNSYLDDLEAYTKLVRTREPRLPLFLMGHSLGGVLAVLFALKHQSELAGLVAMSTVFRLVAPPSPVSLIGARLLSAVVPGLRIDNGLDVTKLSSDPASAADYLADPLVQRNVTVHWVTQFFSHYQKAIERANELQLPVLVLHGGSDPIADEAGAREFEERVASTDKSLRIYPELRHELYRELPQSRARVFADLVSWLAAHSRVR